MQISAVYKTTYKFSRFQYKIISKRFYVIFQYIAKIVFFLKHSQNNQILNVS